MSPRLRRGNWSVQELERLRLLLPFRGVEQTAALLRRSADSVSRKAQDLLRVPPRTGAWTESDDLQLREAWGALELGLLAVMLGRPLAEVRKRALELQQSLKSGRWTREDRRLLKKLYGTRSDDDLVVSLMRRRDDIVSAAKRMCLAKDKKLSLESFLLEPVKSSDSVSAKSKKVKSGRAKPKRTTMPRWTADEIDRLRLLYPNHDNLAVARELGRSVTSVANKAFQLNLKKSAALLTAIGRSNISNRYTEESADEIEQGAIIMPVPPGSVARVTEDRATDSGRSDLRSDLRSGPAKQPLGDQVFGCDDEAAAAED